jgi:hypothetical protein
MFNRRERKEHRENTVFFNHGFHGLTRMGNGEIIVAADGEEALSNALK